MDSARFDSLVRSLTTTGSRRRALTAALTLVVGALGSDRAQAKKKKACPPCKKRKKGKCKSTLPEGTACTDSSGGGGTCQRGSCVATTVPPCVPESAATTCTAGCGRPNNNCNQPVTCPCPSGLTCLLNGTCARVCTGPIGEGCDGCTPTSSCFIPNSEGQRLCGRLPESRCDTLQPCPGGTIDCPQGFACMPECGDLARCVALGVCPPI
jgi:hypothetical protein